MHATLVIAGSSFWLSVGFNAEIGHERPAVQILAPKAWWIGWSRLAGSTRRAAGTWEREFAKLVQDVESSLGVGVECVAFYEVTRADIDYGEDGGGPRIDHAPVFYPVRPGEPVPPIYLIRGASRTPTGPPVCAAVTN